MMKKIYIHDSNCITPLGFDVETNWQALKENRSGIKKLKISENLGSISTSVFDDEKLNDNFSKSIDYQEYTRLEKALILSLKPLVEKHSVSEKSLLIVSTTKGNISLLKHQNLLPEGIYLSDLAQKIADFFQFKSKPIVVSNACVSGVMAVAVAKNLLQNEKYTDAFVIAGDEVSEFIVSGFNSFQALSSVIRKPYDKNRVGINIGEAAAAIYVSREQPKSETFFEVVGDASINDANHISGPHREGEGLLKSVTKAMNEAGISASEVDFISAHGTATLYNDEMESIAFSRAGLSQVPLNSLKAYYGHTLGAAGLLELIMAMESAKHNLLIKSLNFEENGVSRPINIIKENAEKEINYILKTASGFGGSNSAVILKKWHHEEN